MWEKAVIGLRKDGDCPCGHTATLVEERVRGRKKGEFLFGSLAKHCVCPCRQLPERVLLIMRRGEGCF